MKKVLVGILITTLSCISPALASDNEHGGHEAKPHWGYQGAGGPEHWGDLSPEFSACSEGQSQSPIDVVDAQDISLPEISFSYQAVPFHLVNNGHTIMADYAPGSTITLDGKTYKLLQFHFHTPSENAVDNQTFPLEAHLVHVDDNGQLAVVGVMFRVGEANPFIESLWRYMPALANSDVRLTTGSINVTDMLPTTKEYYSWDGSLTTPPCAEGVKWMLLKEPMEVSRKQVAKLESLMHGANNRPIQPLYDRVVFQ